MRFINMNDGKHAWIITVGDEIINGVITDTNREAISRELRAAGISVRGMTSVGDDIKQIADALDMAFERAVITIVSGGLGPTEDDKTSEAAALFMEEELALNEDQLARIEEKFRTWGRKMSSTNQKQALFPKSAIPIPNDYGTAPGFMIEKQGRIGLFFPGVPRELIRMLREQAIPMVSKKLGLSKLKFKTKTLLCYGLSESRLGEILNDLSKDEVGYHLAFLPRFPFIRLRMDLFGGDEAILDKKLLEKEAVIIQRIRENIVSTKGRTFEEELFELLKNRGLTLGLAESITGGYIGEMITRVPGSSEVFMGSIVSYSNHAKETILGVPSEIIDRHGAVSHECAKEMAMGAADKLGSNVGLSVTGVAGPGGGSPEKPVGTFYVGMWINGLLDSRRFCIPGPREWVKTLAAIQSMDMLRRYLLGYRLHGDPIE